MKFKKNILWHLRTKRPVLLLIFQAIGPFQIYITLSIIAMILYSSEVIIRPYFVGRLINSINEMDSLHVATVAFYVLIAQIFFYFSKRLYEGATLRYEPGLKTHIKELSIRHVIAHDFSFFQSHFSGRLISKINDLSNFLPTLLIISINGYLVSFLSVITSLIVLGYINLYLSIAFSMWVIFIIFSSIFYLRRIHHLTKTMSDSDSEITANVVDIIDNILFLKIFTNTNHELSRLQKLQNVYLENHKKYNMFVFIFYLIQGFSFILYQGFCLFVLMELQQKNLISAGLFVMVLIINLRVLDNLWSISDQMRTFSENLGSITQAIKVIFKRPRVSSFSNPKPLIVKEGRIEFQKVTFRYENSPPLFKNLSLIVEAGQKVGIVGHSGSGKTTLVSLIMRLFDTLQGNILIDGQSIKEISQESLWSSISLIPQSTSLFHRTIMENIRYARTNASDQEVFEAAKKAHLHDFICQLPNGYNAMVGDKGTKLSGGQKQRLSIARIFLKDAPILILDESTSQLDSLTEKYIQKSLMALMEKKTTIVIAHRLSTLMKMDRILLLDKGKIIQDGTHKDLSRSGLYKELWSAQTDIA